MELSDIKLKHSDTKRSDAAIYVNTIIGSGSVPNTSILKSGDTGENEECYETLNFDTKKNEANHTQDAGRSLRWEDIPNRLKYAVYVIIVVIVVLFVVDIVVIVLIVLPNSKVDGNWGQWSTWSTCDVSCDNGTQSRMRFCINPTPSNGGLDCSGKSVNTKQCKNYRCSDGGWSNWGSWGSCSDSCGGGVRSRLRECTNPKPSLLGRYCDGSPEHVTICNKQACPAHGGWGQWSPWGSCSVSCGIGKERRNRTCSSPNSIRNGDHCFGESSDDRICVQVTCADGGWSNWGSWGSCSDSCGGGVRSRLRECTNPKPSLLGRYCDGTPEHVSICNKQACPAHGGWGQWSPWGSCSVSCGIGKERRNRTCSSPNSVRNGDHCFGESSDDRICVQVACAVDGNWIQWSPWSHCDVTCNNGTQTRMRFCINPAPSNGGIDCSGKSIDTQPCENDGCSDGGWSSWGSWGSCSDSCDGGVRSRLRTCTNPRPSLLGRYCDGNAEQMMPCNKYKCLDGGWSNWGRWGSCSDSCGGGVRGRLRTCTNPRPSLFGRYCDGSPEKVIPCNKQTCPDHRVAFTAYGSSGGTSNVVIKFPSTRLNIGGGYSTSTGRFTCKIPGIYNFAVTLTKIRKDIDIINAYLRVNGLNKLMLHSDPDDSDNIDYGSYSLSVTGNFHLNKNHYVDVYGDPSYFYNDYKTSFTGVLVIPDE